MIVLEGGIELPYPNSRSAFKKPKDISYYKWNKDLPDRWQRAYTHCLFSLHNLFELPLSSVVPHIAKNMLEADKPFNVVLRFLGEMELEGYIKFDKGFDERIILPTRKLLKLKIAEKDAPETVVVYPVIVGEEYMPNGIVIRGGVRSHKNIRIASVVNDMADERFTVNEFVYDLLEKFPPEDTKLTKSCMYQRTMDTAKKLTGKAFRFPYFLDSRTRMYVTTTCGLTPQGADYEKALLIPLYAEKLTTDGFFSLLEAARGYSEKVWDIETILSHANNPEATYDEWSQADKPYSYMACAELVRLFFKDPERPLPAFTPLDGRCSGLQHWSAVAKSNAITRHLGMHPDEHELDIYEKIAADWSDVLTDDMKHYATRKAAKVPVMTWGYSATQMTSMEHMDKLFGCTSVWSEEEEKYINKDDGLPRAATGALGRDLYKRLNESLGELTEAVKWVCDAATAISKAGFTDIHWITPDGMECKQRKIEGVRKVISVTLSNKEELYVEIKDYSGKKSDSRKHRSAMAPNIIHSLDATHLRMVAKRLKMLGSPMIFIHDSFATHCNGRGALYAEIIDTFIELYSMDYLGDLKKYWEGRYEIQLDDCPELGDFDVETLRGLTKFFM